MERKRICHAFFFASSFAPLHAIESIKVRCSYFLSGYGQPHESLAQRQAGPLWAVGPGWVHLTNCERGNRCCRRVGMRSKRKEFIPRRTLKVNGILNLNQLGGPQQQIENEKADPYIKESKRADGKTSDSLYIIFCS